MANVNTFLAFFGGTGRNQVLSQTLATATATALTLGSDNGTGNTCVLTVPTQAAILGGITPTNVNVNPALLNAAVTQNTFPPYPDVPFNSGTFNGRAIRFRWAGTGSAAANAGNTLQFSLYQGTSATVGSDKLICSNTAVATASAATLNFNIEALILWDSTSGVMTANGNLYMTYNGAIVNSGAPTAWTGAAATGLTNTATALNFVPFVTWGNAVGGVITTTEVSLEVV